MLYGPTGLGGYVMAEQGDPDPATTALLVVGSFVCVLVAAVLVGRLVKDAKNKEQMAAKHASDPVTEWWRFRYIVNLLK